MKSVGAWFVALAGFSMAGPHLLGVRPKTSRQWMHVAVTIAFLAWMLPLMALLRSK
jgi:hypothetical protein